MLKPSDPAAGASPGEEPPVGELVHQLVEDGKAYARAEVNIVKAIASQKASALALPAALFGAAFLLLIGAAVALAVGVLLAIEPLAGPLLSGILAFLIFGAIAGGLAWYALQRIKRDL